MYLFYYGIFWFVDWSFLTFDCTSKFFTIARCFICCGCCSGGEFLAREKESLNILPTHLFLTIVASLFTIYYDFSKVWGDQFEAIAIRF